MSDTFNIWRSLRGLPRDVWVLSIAIFVNRAGTMVLPFLVLYLTKELGFSAPRAGLALAFYGAGSIIAGPLSGRLSDRIGPLPVMRASLVLSGILLLVFPFVRAFYPVLIVTFVWALVSDAFRPANLAVTADIVEPEKLADRPALMVGGVHGSGQSCRGQNDGEQDVDRELCRAGAVSASADSHSSHRRDYYQIGGAGFRKQLLRRHASFPDSGAGHWV